jgi:MerR family copper efflux transcriptional regulator
MASGNGDLLTIGAMSRASGATPRAIRFYEGLGLVNSCQRSRGGYRLFRKGELNRLELVTGLRKSGLSIKEIVKLFTAAEQNPTAAAAAREIKRMLNHRAAEVAETAEALRRLGTDLIRTSEILTGCLGCDAGFDELNCGECELFGHIPKDEVPTSLRALWPMQNS